MLLTIIEKDLQKTMHDAKRQQLDPWTGQFLLFPMETPSHVLPTNSTADRHPIHRWFGFVPGFSPEYVRQNISQAQLDTGDTVLDPFVGCGTTLVESNVLGVKSVGFEPHPFLADICRAKLLVEAPQEWVSDIRRLFENVLSKPIKGGFSQAAEKFLLKLIPGKSLEMLRAARDICFTLKGGKVLLARLIISRVLDLCSHSKTDGIYKAPTSLKNAADYGIALEKVCAAISDDLRLAKDARMKNLAHVYQSSSEYMIETQDRSCSLLITSPPYLNNFDFAEMTRMYLYFWGYANNWNEITERVRAKLIVNTTTALKGHKEKLQQYRKETPSSVHHILDNYQSRLVILKKERAGKKEYDSLIYPYFAQMTRVLKRAELVLKPNSLVRIIVSDAALYGVHIKTQEVLGTILETLGYQDVVIRKLRSRGTRWILEKRDGSPDGLGEYELAAMAPYRARGMQ